MPQPAAAWPRLQGVQCDRTTTLSPRGWQAARLRCQDGIKQGRQETGCRRGSRLRNIVVIMFGRSEPRPPPMLSKFPDESSRISRRACSTMPYSASTVPAAHTNRVAVLSPLCPAKLMSDSRLRVLLGQTSNRKTTTAHTAFTAPVQELGAFISLALYQR